MICFFRHDVKKKHPTTMSLRNPLVTATLAMLLGMPGLASPGNAEESTGPSTGPQPPDGFTTLFNGVDLSGWKGLVENPEKRAEMSAGDLASAQKTADRKMREHWRVVDGMLEFDGRGKNTTLNLCTAAEYGDFELFVDWKILEAGDSGIYLRGSPQIQIWDTDFKDYWKIGADKGSGAMYNNKKNARSPLVKADKPVGEWNTFHIRMIGEKVTVRLNGQLVVDDTVMENFWARDKPIYARGAIELQNHSNLIWFRNIYLRELPGKAEASLPPNEAELIGHWKLTADAKDSSAKDNHGISHGVKLGANGAFFDGRKNYVEVKSSVSMETGSAPFSIAAWVRTDAELDDVLGDVISKFDPQSRRGFILNIKHNVGATNSQANYRHLQFGIDNGRVDEKWTDHGRPGQAVLIFSMAVFDDELFVGTCVAGKDQAG